MPTTNPGSGAFPSLGCYSDNVAGRALPVQLDVGDGGLSVERCTAACAGQGFAIAGVEYGQGLEFYHLMTVENANNISECFCGDALDNDSGPVGGVPELSGCNMLCTGNTLEFCGGPNRLNIYGSLPTATPTPTPEVTPEVTPTPEPTPEAITPSVIDEVTPEVTPTPDPTPEVVPEATPTPQVTSEASAATTKVTPEATPVADSPPVVDTTPEPTPVAEAPAGESSPDATPEVQAPAVETPVADSTPAAPAEVTSEPTPDVAESPSSSSASTRSLTVTPTHVVDSIFPE